MSVQLTFFFVHYMFCVKRTTILSIFATANLMCAEQGPLMKRIYQDKTIRLGFPVQSLSVFLSKWDIKILNRWLQIGVGFFLT